MNVKIEKVNKLIQRHLSDILIKDYYSKCYIITIIKVETDSNLLLSKVFISSFNNTDYVVKLLNSVSKKIENSLFNKLKSIRIPKLIFINDIQNKFF